MGPAEERELIERARSGDAGARETLARCLYPRLFASALRLTRRREAAEDLAQETVIRSLRALDGFDGRSALFTWAYRILVNLWLNFSRKEGQLRGATAPFDSLHSDAENLKDGDARPDRRAMGRESLERLWEAIHNLPESLRVTLLLVVFEDLNYGEVGEALGCSEGTVAWRIFRAREILRGQFEDDLGPASGE